MAWIYDFTVGEVDALKPLAAKYDAGEIITSEDLNAAIARIGALYKSAPVFQSVEISAGVVEIERTAQVSYISVDTEGQAASDTLTTINTTGTAEANDGDLFIFKITSAARDVEFEGDTGNLVIKGDERTLSEVDHFIALRYFGGSYIHQYGYPLDEDILLLLSGTDQIVSSNTVAAESPYLRLVSELSGETQATGTNTITASAGSVGDIQVYVDEGAGNFLIGSAAYTTPTATNAVAGELAFSITNDPTHDYTGVAVGSVVTVTAPAGRGATANGYILSHAEGGGLTATTVSFASGADGTEQDATLDTITGGSMGSVVVLENTMSTNTISLVSGGNISVSATRKMLAGSIAFLIYNGTNWLLLDPSSIEAAKAWRLIQSGDSPATLAVGERLVLVDASGGNITVTLPALSAELTGLPVEIKRSDSSVNTVEIIPAGTDKIDGVNSSFFMLGLQADRLIKYDSSNWFRT